MMAKKRGTRPLGPGTKNLSVNIPVGLREELESLADASGMKLSAYIRTILTKTAKTGTTFNLVEQPRARKKAPSPPKKSPAKKAKPSRK